MGIEEIVPLVVSLVTLVSGLIGGTFLFSRQKRFEAQMTAKAAQLTELHRKRADIVGTLYGMLNSTMRKCDCAMVAFAPAGTPSFDERAQDFVLSFKKIEEYFLKNEVWLSNKTCRQVFELMALMTPSIECIVDSTRPYSSKEPKDQLTELKLFREKAPSALDAVKAEFRQILGVGDIDFSDVKAT